MKRVASRTKRSLPLAGTLGLGLADFKGVYVATLSGTFHTSGAPFYGFVYLDADGNGGVTGGWEIQVPNGTILGGLGPAQSTYTVTAQGRVELTLASTASSNVLSVTVYLADNNQSILGRGGFVLGGNPPAGGVGSICGRKQ
jgi:hypothetical protein